MPVSAERTRQLPSNRFQLASIRETNALRKQRNQRSDLSNQLHSNVKSGAGEGIRTLDPNLGKVVLYP